MNRFLSVAVVSVFVMAGSQSAQAAAWRLEQPSGETVILSVTESAIQIQRGSRQVDIPIERVIRVRVTKHYLDPFERLERSPSDTEEDRRVSLFDAGLEVDEPSAGFLLALAGGVLAAAAMAAVVDPEAFLHIAWRDGDVWQSESVRTGFFTPFIKQRLRAAGLDLN